MFACCLCDLTGQLYLIDHKIIFKPIKNTTAIPLKCLLYTTDQKDQKLTTSFV